MAMSVAEAARLRALADEVALLREEVARLAQLVKQPPGLLDRLKGKGSK